MTNSMKSLGKICMPQRYVLSFMGFLGLSLAYIMRAGLSIAITQMVTVVSTDSFNYTDPNVCPYSNEEDSSSSSNSTSTGKGERYDWDETTQGLILSAFYYGYILTHIPGGLLAQRYGGKHTLGWGIASTALFTIATPLVVPYGATPVFILRVLMGMGEGTTFPALSTLLAAWSPPLERSKLSAFAFAGVQIGTVIATTGGGLILANMDWAWVFYIFGASGLVWFVVWCLICYNDPSSHPFISDEEKKYILQTIGETERKKGLVTPWKEILTSGPVWALIIAETGHDFGLYGMVTDLPKYMNDVLRFKISENGVLSSLPYLATWLTSILLGWVTDKIIEKKWMSLNAVRKWFATGGAVLPAIFLLAASYAGCARTAVVALFTIGMGTMGFCYSSIRVNSLDLSPNFAGTIMALANGIGSISGMVAPTLIGALTPNRTLLEWRIVFWVMFAVLVGSNFVYIFLGSADVQSWNDSGIESKEAEEGGEKRRKSTLTGGEPIREKYKDHYPQTFNVQSS